MKGRWVLLGEDDPSDAKLTELSLTQSGLVRNIVVAADGSQVLDQLYRRGSYVEQGQGPPALVLLNLKMPKMDGLEVLGKIKTDPHIKCTPVVMLTSSGRLEDLKRCYQLGANGYIVKSMDFKEYTQALGVCAHFWLIVNELPSDSGQ